MGVRHYPRNAQSRTDKVLAKRFPLGLGPRAEQSAYDGFLATRPDVDTTDVASTVWGR